MGLTALAGIWVPFFIHVKPVEDLTSCLRKSSQSRSSGYVRSMPDSPSADLSVAPDQHHQNSECGIESIIRNVAG